ncbi:ATP-dependent protease La Type I [Candidatus Similichlamydia laticola]|uniref:Lon protease n=1 Tax=Candidatus Similichlamydia laticola TaxID=2170265 RepID=A0A369KIH8_9BACT|nr:endopeptidase La [Candidatus Similichlamydia laticola]RDB31574.1 ATP-dependent protease La Type I [Candidatus Similichlamydia laticola]
MSTERSKQKKDRQSLVEEASPEDEPTQDIGRPSVVFPKELLILPVFKRPYFPGIALPISIESGVQYETIKKIACSDLRTVGVLLSKGSSAECSSDQLYQVGVAGRVSKILPAEHGGFQAIVDLEKRFRVLAIKQEKDHFWAEVEYLQDEVKVSANRLKAYANSILKAVKELIALSPLFKDEMRVFLEHADPNQPAALGDMIASLTTAQPEELQDLVECLLLEERLKKTLFLVKKEHDLSKIQYEIDQQVESALGRIQKEYVLKEQLKTIKKELGIDSDDRHSEISKFESRLQGKVVPQEVLSVMREEMHRLASLESHSPDYGVCRNYLDWLTAIPWGMYDEHLVSIKKTKQILNREHWGVEEVKERICEIVAVSNMVGKMKGTALCLVGPPGVGKTTIAKSIATALGRKFFKFSVGGMRDEAEVKGHRKTYIGSMPGKFVQALKACQSMNPVILVDEIDKIMSGQLGDPASALLEVFDREQNGQFLDHYLDLPCDLSRVFFVLSANLLDHVPDALRDRFEVIHLSGYITEEKIQIAQKHLIPNSLEEVGLNPGSILFPVPILKTIVSGYAREAGVRNFEGQIKKICRKLVTEHVNTAPKKEFGQKEVTEASVRKLLGIPRFQEDPLVQSPPIGVAVGLAWTALGGTPLCVETLTVSASRTAMRLTGQAGSVMKESAEIAWSFCQSWLLKQHTGSKFFFKKEVHIHLPEGATPKDGPSAGITMVSALLSQLLQKKIKPGLSMTGELTLNGHVLPVGGIREKVAAAKRAQLKHIILPALNKQDVEELPTLLKRGLTLHFVSVYDEVFRIAFDYAPFEKGRAEAFSGHTNEEKTQRKKRAPFA